MQPPANAPYKETRPPTRTLRRRTKVGAGLAALLLAGTFVTYLVLANSATAASAEAFRFEAVYLRPTDMRAVNESTIKVDMWFTNTERPDLRSVTIVAIAVEQGRGIAVSKSQLDLGKIAGRQTRNAEIELSLNLSRSNQIDLLVLAEGLLIARGQGSLGFDQYRMHDSELALGYSLEGDFTYDYMTEK